jgi:hypothetical protein
MKLGLGLIGASIVVGLVGCGQAETKPTTAPVATPAPSNLEKNPNLKNMPPEARQQLLQQAGGGTR